MSQFFKVSITQLKISRPFLKVFARNLKGRHVEELKKLKDLYEKTEASDIEVGEMAVAKLSASQFERCRILKSVKASGNAFVYFIDSGCFGNIKHNQVKRRKK